MSTVVASHDTGIFRPYFWIRRVPLMNGDCCRCRSWSWSICDWLGHSRLLLVWIRWRLLSWHWLLILRLSWLHHRLLHRLSWLHHRLLHRLSWHWLLILRLSWLHHRLLHWLHRLHRLHRLHLLHVGVSRYNGLTIIVLVLLRFLIRVHLG